MSHRLQFSRWLLCPGLALCGSLLAMPAHAEDAGARILNMPVYTSGDGNGRDANQDVPVLKYSLGDKASPSSNTATNNKESILPDKGSVQKKLDALFVNGKPVRIIAVPPSVTKDNHSTLYPSTSADGTAILNISPYIENSLIYKENSAEFLTKDAPAFENFDNNQVVYGFIVDGNGSPLARVYAPAEGYAKAVALAKWYNGKMHSTLSVAIMNASKGGRGRIYAPDIGSAAFVVNLIGTEPVIHPDPDDGNSLEDKAKKVIARYGDTRESCPGDMPAWQCSGLIIRTTNDYPFTVKSGEIVASYSFVRSDTATHGLWDKSQGLILNPESVKKQEAAQCNYPMDADT